MAAKKTVTYECEVCGTEVTVNSECMSTLSPIYCCGSALGSRGKGTKKPASKASSKGTGKQRTAASASTKKSAGTATRRTTKKLTARKRTRK